MRLLWGAVASILLSGCVPGPMGGMGGGIGVGLDLIFVAAFSRGGSWQQVPVATREGLEKDNGLVLVFRDPESPGDPHGIEVTDNGAAVGRIAPGGIVSWQRPRGAMELNLAPSFGRVGRLKPLTVEVEAGEVHAFRIYLPKEGGPTASFALVQFPRGFWFDRPQGATWYVETFRDDKLVFAADSPSGRHALFVGVERASVSQPIATPEEYLAHVRGKCFGANPNFYEYRVREAELTDKFGQFCVKYHYAYTERTRPTRLPYVTREGRCYVCLHPDTKEYEFNVCRSEVYAQGEEDPQLQAQATDFFETFRFQGFSP